MSETEITFAVATVGPLLLLAVGFVGEAIIMWRHR